MQVIKLKKETNRLKAEIIKQTEYFVFFLLYFTIRRKYYLIYFLLGKSRIHMT
jgi:hypothetical protein